jgi:DNA-binding CsgD family transcriptional regulator/tetratricopeptide (TPR) repeat protein
MGRVSIAWSDERLRRVYDCPVAMLLERDAELGRLEALLADAGGGHGRVVFVGGEAGIGKTALVATFAQSACGGRVAVGRCDALATPRALGPFLDAAGVLGLDAPLDRDGLLGCLVGDLRRCTQSTVLVVEDAHWADDATIELVAMLGRRAVDLPLLLVITYREDEVTTEHPLRRVIGDLVTASATVWLGLRPLSLEAVRALAEASGADADLLYERSGGNPFYVTEALAAPTEVVPTTVRLAVLARVARLGPASRAVLDAVAVVPGRAESWLVDGLCSPPPGAVEACVEGGVLLAADGMYAFRHELARRAVEDDLSEVRRGELHRRAVDALQARPSVDPARIAHHADAGGDNAALARSARAACLLAAARTAHREAVRHGEQALAVRHELTDDEVAELKVRMAPSLMACARGDDAAAFAGEAVEHWRAVSDDRREAEALVEWSTALAGLGHIGGSMPPLERAVELLEGHPAGRELGAAYLRLASAHKLVGRYSGGDRARDRNTALAWGKRAITLARELDDQAVLARAMIETGIADMMDGHVDGLARVREGIEIGRRQGLPDVVAQGLVQIGSGCGELRRFDEAVPALVEGVAVATEHHLEFYRLYLVAWLAHCRFHLGEWDAAEAQCRDALTGSPTMAGARFVALNTLGWLRARRGADDVWPLLDEALAIARDTGQLQRLWPVAVARAEAGWLQGTLDEHVPLLEEALALAERYRLGIAAGNLGLWLARADRPAGSPQDAADPFARWVAGDHLGAAAVFRHMGCPYEAASALADSNDTSSMREAHATFERLGAVPMADTVAAGLRARGVRVTARRQRRTGHAPGLSERELEVLKLVAAGFTNPQIATVLFISRKTAEHHVSAILVKLGVTTRAQAAAAAVRLGIGTGVSD